VVMCFASCVCYRAACVGHQTPYAPPEGPQRLSRPHAYAGAPCDPPHTSIGEQRDVVGGKVVTLHVSNGSVVKLTVLNRGRDRVVGLDVPGCVGVGVGVVCNGGMCVMCDIVQ
jgi:hypothetical protein